MSTQNYIDSVLREWWNDETRTYHQYDEQGVETFTRPYTEEENANADRAEVVREHETNAETLYGNIRQAYVANRQLINQLTTVANGTGALTNAQRDQYIRQLADVQARAFRQLNAVARILAQDFSDTE